MVVVGVIVILGAFTELLQVYVRAELAVNVAEWPLQRRTVARYSNNKRQRIYSEITDSCPQTTMRVGTSLQYKKYSSPEKTMVDPPVYVYVNAPWAAKVKESPAQIAPLFILTVGNELTVTFTNVEPEQPRVLVPVMVYIVLELGTMAMEEPVTPVLHV